jgi:hypothetical protein
MKQPPDYQLVCPFPNDNRQFAHGVEWEMFRRQVYQTPAAFSDYVMESNAENIVAMCMWLGREAEARGTDWPGWKMIHVKRSDEPQMKNAPSEDF